MTESEANIGMALLVFGGAYVLCLSTLILLGGGTRGGGALLSLLIALVYYHLDISANCCLEQVVYVSWHSNLTQVIQDHSDYLICLGSFH